MQVEGRLVLLLGALMVGLWLLGRDVAPGGVRYRLLAALLTGLVLLLGWNACMAPAGLPLGVNPAAMLTAGFLGLPGLALLLVCAAL